MISMSYMKIKLLLLMRGAQVGGVIHLKLRK